MITKDTGSRALSVKEVESQMTPALRTMVPKLRELWNDSEVFTVKRKHEFGKLCQQILEDKEKYGNSSFEQLAVALAISVRQLHYMCTIATTFNDDEIEKLCDERDAAGYAFTWTHLRCVASVPKKGDRSTLIKTWKREGLGTDEFALRVKALVDSKTPTQGEATDLSEGSSSAANDSGSVTTATIRSLVKKAQDLDTRCKFLEGVDFRTLLAEPDKRELLEKFMETVGHLSEVSAQMQDRVVKLSEELATSEVVDFEAASDDDEDVMSNLLDGLDDESDGEDMASQIINKQVAAPRSSSGRRAINGLPGSKKSEQAAKKSKSKPKPRPIQAGRPAPKSSGKKTGPASRRRRGTVTA